MADRTVKNVKESDDFLGASQALKWPPMEALKRE